MERTRSLVCEICGRETDPTSRFFLLAASRWGDRLKILRWHPDLAPLEGVHLACRPDHVAELVLHWIVMGSLDHPFIKDSGTGYQVEAALTGHANLPADSLPRQFSTGELALRRESLRAILEHNPQSMIAIMEALILALQKGPMPESDQTELPEEEVDVACVC